MALVKTGAKHYGATLVGVVIAVAVFVIGLLAVAASLLFAYSMQLRSGTATKGLLDVQSGAEREYLRWALETHMSPKALADGEANGKNYDFTADGQSQTVSFKNKNSETLFDMVMQKYRYPKDISVLNGRKHEIYVIGRK